MLATFNHNRAWLERQMSMPICIKAWTAADAAAPMWGALAKVKGRYCGRRDNRNRSLRWARTVCDLGGGLCSFSCFVARTSTHDRRDTSIDTSIDVFRGRVLTYIPQSRTGLSSVLRGQISGSWTYQVLHGLFQIDIFMRASIVP